VGGHTEVIFALLEEVKGNPEFLNSLFSPDIDGNTPLHFAVTQEYEEIVAVLLEAAKGNPELLKVLFAPNKTTGLTPLRWAARDGCTEVVEVLLAYGACPSLSMLLNNTFSAEMNSLLRSAFVKCICSVVSNISECASQVLYGNMIELYDEEHTRAEQNRQRNNNDDTRHH
jgi:ankyrin repeat protein